jgi:hypothetical protein
MRLTFAERIGSLRFRRYQHERHGIVETLTKDTVTYVRPVFGLLKSDDHQQPEVMEFTRRRRSPNARVGDSARALGNPTNPKPTTNAAAAGAACANIAPDKKVVIRRNP